MTQHEHVDIKVSAGVRTGNLSFRATLDSVSVSVTAVVSEVIQFYWDIMDVSPECRGQF
jgi:hypothetical protein